MKLITLTFLMPLLLSPLVKSQEIEPLIEQKAYIQIKSNDFQLPVSELSKRQRQTTEKNKIKVTTPSATYEEIINIPWGTEAGFPDKFFVSFEGRRSTPSKKMKRLIRLPINSLKVDPWGNINILTEGIKTRNPKIQTWLYRFSPQGELLSRTQFQEAGYIQDFVVDEAGYTYFLKSRDVYLSKFTPGGKLVWKSPGIINSDSPYEQQQDPYYDKLLMDSNSNAYVAITRRALPSTTYKTSRPAAFKINSENGTLEFYQNWGEKGFSYKRVFMDGQGNIYSPFYVEPIGIDKWGREYSLSERYILRYEQERVTWEERMRNIVLLPEKNGLYISQPTNASREIDIRGWEQGGSVQKQIKLVLPENVVPGWNGIPTLIHIDSQGNYYIHGGETRTEEPTLMIFSPQGVLKSSQKPAPPFHLLRYYIPIINPWAVDLEGNIYLPILGPKSFHVIKITPIDQAK